MLVLDCCFGVLDSGCRSMTSTVSSNLVSKEALMSESSQAFCVIPLLRPLLLTDSLDSGSYRPLRPAFSLGGTFNYMPVIVAGRSRPLSHVLHAVP